MVEEQTQNSEDAREDIRENNTEQKPAEEARAGGRDEARETGQAQERPPARQRRPYGQSQGGRRSGDNRRSGPSRRYNRRLKKVCQFCQEGAKSIDYKRVDVLQRFVTERGNIRSRRKVGTCAKHQRQLAVAIKRARHLALLPYTADHIRGA